MDPEDADYTEIVVSGTLFVGSFVIDRYGQMYLSGGVTFGTSSILLIPNVSFDGGHIGSGLDQSMPDTVGMSQFLTGPALNASAGYGIGGGITVSPGTVSYVPELYGFNRNNPTVAPYSFEQGLYTPQASVSVTLGFQLPFICTFCNTH